MRWRCRIKLEMTRDRIYKFAVLISTSSAPEFKVFSQSLPLLALAVYKDRMVGKKKAQDVVKFEAKTVWVFLPPPGSEGIRTNSKETLPRWTQSWLHLLLWILWLPTLHKKQSMSRPVIMECPLESGGFRIQQRQTLPPRKTSTGFGGCPTGVVRVSLQ